MTAEEIERYLRLLGVRRAPPSLSLLREVVFAHLTRVPFENVSKLHWRRTLGLTAVPDLPLFLEGIERYHFGGTCYSTNYHLYLLLTALGFEATLSGADMAAPDVHMVVLVVVDGRDFLVDGGYAAPFLEPMPRDLATEYVVELGVDRFVLSPRDAFGNSRLALYRDGERKHGYYAKAAPRRFAEFHAVVADSFRPAATFMNALLLSRFWPGRSLTVRNLAIVENEGPRSTTRSVRDPRELCEKVEELFGIPAEIVESALAELPALRDPWE